MFSHKLSKQVKLEGSSSLGSRRPAVISDAFTLVLPRAAPKLVLPPTPTTPESEASDRDYTLSWIPRTPSSPKIGPIKDAYLPPTPPPEECDLTLSPPSSIYEELACVHPEPALTPSGPTKDNSFTGILKAGHQLHDHLVSAYTIVDELGSGGFGVVVRGLRRQDGRAVAIKLMWKSRVPKESWISVQGWCPSQPMAAYTVAREAYVLRKVDCQGVVSFVDYFQDDTFAYLIMEYFGSPWNTNDMPPPPPVPSANSVRNAAVKQISKIMKAPILNRNNSLPTLQPPSARPVPIRRASCDLFECLEQYDHMPEETSRYIFKQIVDSVAYLHARGIVHCDLKDENIVIDADFRVKLIDFGSALMLDPMRPAPFQEHFRGTVNFAAPEILEGQLFQAPSAEIWALGCILSILMTGRGPFPDAAAAIKGQISVPSVPMSKNAFSLMMGCLHVRPRSRLTIMQVQSHPWFQEGC